MPIERVSRTDTSVPQHSLSYYIIIPQNSPFPHNSASTDCACMHVWFVLQGRWDQWWHPHWSWELPYWMVGTPLYSRYCCSLSCVWADLIVCGETPTLVFQKWRSNLMHAFCSMKGIIALQCSRWCINVPLVQGHMIGVAQIRNNTSCCPSWACGVR